MVEIQAHGQGLSPTLDELFTCQREGFTLESVDSNLAVTQFVSDGRVKKPQADRNWQLTYRRGKDLRGDVIFRFPSLKNGIKPASLEYKHYQDADLVTVNARQAADGVKLVSQVSNGLRNAILLVLLGAMIAGLVIFLRRKAAKAHIPAAVLTAPDQLTPFTAVAFLRRIQQHHATRLGESDRAALSKQIAELEAGYFRDGQTPGLDLTAIVGKWLRAVA